MSATPCPQVARWRQFLDGALPAEAAAGLAMHLDGCRACLQVLDRLTSGSEPWLHAARGAEQPAADPALRRVVRQLQEEGEPGEASEPDLGFLDPPTAPGSIGRLGPYDVVSVIGRGGMGVVLKAFDPPLHRYVAIKVLGPAWAGGGAARQRFAREARATAAVRHDNVIAIYGVDDVRGLPYLVMEYVHGTSLQQRLDRHGPLGTAEVLRIGVQVAAGLAAAHAQGLVHRDVKPSNILLEHGVERIKLSDFGLARAADDANLTQSGVIPGTPQYMAPEQALGEPVDHRADLFSLGSVLYTCCTGRAPFRAPSMVAVLRRVAEDEPRPIREINPDVPEWLVQIIARLHAKHPIERFQSAQEVSRLLEQHLAHLRHPTLVAAPLGPPRPSTPRRRRAPSLVIFVLAMVLLFPCIMAGLLLAYALVQQAPPPAPPVVAQAPEEDRLEPEVRLTGGKVEQLPNGKVRFRVRYEMEPAALDPNYSYVWEVRFGDTLLHRQVFRSDQLKAQGTLEAEQPGVQQGGLTSYLEGYRLVPGGDWKRRGFSNVVPLEP